MAGERLMARFEIAMVVEGDMSGILEIEKGSFSPPWTHEQLLSEIYNDDSFFVIARNPNDMSIIGYVILRRVSDIGELLSIAVAESSRGKGAGESLLLAALAFAKENGLITVFLEVRKSNAAAVSLYIKHGFKPIRLRKNYYEEPVEDAVEMGLDLTGGRFSCQEMTSGKA